MVIGLIIVIFIGVCSEQVHFSCYLLPTKIISMPFFYVHDNYYSSRLQENRLKILTEAHVLPSQDKTTPQVSHS